MNIGIMGGTFNPVHSGHIAFLHAFIHQIALDICYVIPARRSPFRMNEPLAEDIHRLNMLHLACDQIPNIIVSDMEIRREGLSYTIDTVSEIQHAYPDAHIYLLIGEDQAHRFKEWKQWEDLLSSVHLCIVQRTLDANVQLLIHELIHGTHANPPIIINTPLFHVSSTLIRESVVQGRSIEGLVPESVEKYIVQHQLYASL
ncbi:MAG: nicotinate (nicotinamide) nucleotide adenylyltransferase [Ignavibacteria bacterium]